MTDSSKQFRVAPGDNGGCGSGLQQPAHTEIPAANETPGNDGTTQKPKNNTGDVGETEPPNFVHTYNSYIQFDYGQLPDDAGGTLQLYGKFGNLLVLRGEWPVATHNEMTGRLPAGPYVVLLVGDTVWNSDWFEVADQETRTVVLRSDDSAQTVAVTVLDEQTGEPLEGAVLKLACTQTPELNPEAIPGVMAITGADGRASLTGQPVGVFTYVVEKLGYLPAEASSSPVARGECNLGVIRLVQATGEVVIEFDFVNVENYIDATIGLQDATSRKVYSHPKFETETEYALGAIGNVVSKQKKGRVRFLQLVPGRCYTATVYVSLGKKVAPDPLTGEDFEYLGNGQYADNDVYPGVTLQFKKDVLSFYLRE